MKKRTLLRFSIVFALVLFFLIGGNAQALTQLTVYLPASVNEYPEFPLPPTLTQSTEALLQPVTSNIETKINSYDWSGINETDMHIEVDHGDTLDYTYYLPLVSLDCRSYPYIPSTNISIEETIEDEINIIRIENGLSALEKSNELTQAARRHSKDMADTNLKGHIGSDGSTHVDRIKDSCYQDPYLMDEIAGWGFAGNPHSMINWWMNSPGHRAAILEEEFIDFGAGYIYNQDNNNHRFTVNFAARVCDLFPWLVPDCASGSLYPDH